MDQDFQNLNNQGGQEPPLSNSDQNGSLASDPQNLNTPELTPNLSSFSPENANLNTEPSQVNPINEPVEPVRVESSLNDMPLSPTVNSEPVGLGGLEEPASVGADMAAPENPVGVVPPGLAPLEQSQMQPSAEPSMVFSSEPQAIESSPNLGGEFSEQAASMPSVPDLSSQDVPLSPAGDSGIVAFQNPEAHELAPEPKIKNKKPLKIALAILATLITLGGLGAAGYFGYNFYIAQSDSRILAAAAKNAIEAKDMSIDFRAGMSGISVGGKLSVDKNQNFRLNVENDFFPIELTYLKERDSAYLKEPGSMFGESTGNENSYIEFKNILKAAEKYGFADLGFDGLNPNKDYFTEENLKYFERLEDEKSDGKELFLYKLKPDDEAQKRSVEEINKKLKEIAGDELSGGLKSLESDVNFWIGKDDFKVYKIEGKTSGKYFFQVPDYTQCNSILDDRSYYECIEKPKKKTIDQSVSYEWSLKFNYEAQQEISMPKDYDVSETVDALKFEEEISRSAEADTTSINSFMRQEVLGASDQKIDKTNNHLIANYLTQLTQNFNNRFFNIKYPFGEDE